MRDPLEPLLAARSVIVLDGGLATTLEAGGAGLADPLWSARVLRDEPHRIREVHRAFLRAGAQVLSTASYQATVPGLRAAGLSRKAALALVRRSVELAREAAELEGTNPLVAGSVGPWGAFLADGSEYTGDYVLTTRELADFHRPRMKALADAGCDLLAIETQPRLDEAVIAAELAAEAGVAVWVSFTTADGERLPDGGPLAEAFASVAAIPGVVAVGVNCCGPNAAVRAVSAIPQGVRAVAYPNIGDRWDADHRAWVRGNGDPGPETWGPSLVDAGAVLVGGCCGTSPADIAALDTSLAQRE